jgi:penicillin amidase
MENREPEGQLPRKRRLGILARLVSSLLRPPSPHTFPPLAPAQLPPMRGRIEVLRDANAVVHIYAEQEPDLYATLGYMQGADRFVLLDVIRHFGAGRLCELLGDFRMPKGSQLLRGKSIGDIDAFVRPLEFEAQSRHDFDRMHGRGQECLEAFAAGINAALRAMQGRYPPEYLLFGALRPWHASDALLAAQACALTVALSPLDVELTFDAIRGHLRDDAAQRLFPEAPWADAPTTYPVVEGPEPEPPIHLSAGGSNNWAVSAARSASGAPIVANDPHVPFLPLPTFWYHAHLECPRYRVQGGLMLGCPIFGYGHNGALAWGVTTAYRDSWDLYRVHRLPGDRSRYRTASGTGTITKHLETHRVRFGRERPVEWERCEHGVIYPGWKHHDGVDLALRYVGADLGRYFEGYLALAEATTVAAHQQALALINEGPFDFNHVYGHKDGHIAWEPFGRLPRRRADGLFVRDADDPAGQWDGFLPFSENPKIVNPACGYVASANAVTDPTNFRAATTRVHPEPRHRQDRIEAFLAASTAHTAATFAALQRNVGSDYGPPLRDALLALLGGRESRGAMGDEGVRVLRAWDGSFGCDSAGAPLFVFTQQELAQRVFVPLLGTNIGHRFVSGRRAIPRLQRLLLDPADPLRGDVERAAGRPLGVLVDEAFMAALRRVAQRCGERPAEWRWGRFQHIRLATVLGEIPLLGRRFRSLDAPFSGDVYTVSPSVPAPMGGRLRAFVGATSRFICDLATPDEALFAHTSGPSGDIGAVAFGRGLSAAWYRFEYFRSALWKAEEVPNVLERLVVEPSRLDERGAPARRCDR